MPAPGAALPVPVSSIPESAGERRPTGLPELDRVLGGGLFEGSVVLIGGEPGIGKSTLMLQLARNLCDGGATVLYASAEESPEQVSSRARRLGCSCDGLLILSATRLEDITAALSSTGARFLVVDSVQTIHSGELTGAPGSVGQVRHCASVLSGTAKPAGVTVLLVGHVTKDGLLAGPKVLEHLVDAVVGFEGDSGRTYRILRAVKNRYGPSGELGVFEMTAGGLAGVQGSAVFLPCRGGPARPGTVVGAVIEGTRPLLVEVQALTSPTRYGYPQRVAVGFDSRRLPVLLAVLERRCGLELGAQDVFVSVAGGVALSDPGADLAVCLAVASSRLDRCAPVRLAVSAEVGLGGELRPVHGFDRRLREARSLGFGLFAGSLEDCGEDSEALLGHSTLSRCIGSVLEPGAREGGFPV
jgi:DNA repair protein RadA/Sms